jgi:thioesterase domain-containing protein
MEPAPAAADPARLAALQSLLRSEIPLAAQMRVAIDRLDDAGLWLSMPLEPNRNLHQTAFAGSLNALCTLAGWAMTHVLLERLAATGATVVRRSSIKYHRPVESSVITACCQPPRPDELGHFAEMLAEKGQGKLDLVVEIAGSTPGQPAVLFAGNYVVSRSR